MLHDKDIWEAYRVMYGEHLCFSSFMAMDITTMGVFCLGGFGKGKAKIGGVWASVAMENT